MTRRRRTVEHIKQWFSDNRGTLEVGLVLLVILKVLAQLG